MGNLLSKRPNITSHDKAILDLKIQRDRVVRYRKELESRNERSKQIAKALLGSGNKRKALLVLRKAKYDATLLEKTDLQLHNLEEMLSNIEFKLVEKDVLCGLAKGNEALREIQEHMKIEDIEAIMDDTQEAMAYQRHVSELLTAQLSDADEEEVEHELEKLQRDEMAAFEERIPSVPKVPIAQASLGFEEEQGRTRRDGPVGHGSQALPAT